MAKTDYRVRADYVQLIPCLTPEGVDALLSRVSPGARAELLIKTEYDEEIEEAFFAVYPDPSYRKR